jgi:hypothetical protein
VIIYRFAEPKPAPSAGFGYPKDDSTLVNTTADEMGPHLARDENLWVVTWG